MTYQFIISCILVASAVHAYVTFDGKTVPPLPQTANVYNCTTAFQFRAALNTQTANRIIVLANGTYAMGNYEYLTLTADGLTIRGATDDPNGVVIVGKGMDNCVDVEEEIFRFEGANNVTIANLTISECRCNAVKFQSGPNANVILQNIHFLNVGERMIKGPHTLDAQACSIRYCLFENTRVPPSIRCGGSTVDSSGDYIAGMDIMNADNWVVHDNCFLNIKGATGQGRAACFFWHGDTNIIVERNTFINCDRAISYGSPGGGDGTTMVVGGYIRNNMILAGGTIGIDLNGSTNVKVYNNTSFSSLGSSGGIISNQNQGCEIKNNILLGSITYLGEGEAPDTAKNVFVSRTQKAIIARWFQDEANADLHLKTDTASVVNCGLNLSGVTNDWDNLPRSDGQTDIGADEYSNNPADIDVAAVVSGKTYLGNPTPNPFNPSTLIRYGISNNRSGAFITITIISPDGRRMKTLVKRHQLAGNYAIVWDGTNEMGHKAASGMYCIRLSTGREVMTTKAVFIQ